MIKKRAFVTRRRMRALGATALLFSLLLLGLWIGGGPIVITLRGSGMVIDGRDFAPVAGAIVLGRWSGRPLLRLDDVSPFDQAHHGASSQFAETVSDRDGRFQLQGSRFIRPPWFLYKSEDLELFAFRTGLEFRGQWSDKAVMLPIESATESLDVLAVAASQPAIWGTDLDAFPRFQTTVRTLLQRQPPDVRRDILRRVAVAVASKKQTGMGTGAFSLFKGIAGLLSIFLILGGGVIVLSRNFLRS